MFLVGCSWDLKDWWRLFMDNNWMSTSLTNVSRHPTYFNYKLYTHQSHLSKWSPAFEDAILLTTLKSVGLVAEVTQGATSWATDHSLQPLDPCCFPILAMPLADTRLTIAESRVLTSRSILSCSPSVPCRKCHAMSSALESCSTYWSHRYRYTCAIFFGSILTAPTFSG